VTYKDGITAAIARELGYFYGDWKINGSLTDRVEDWTGWISPDSKPLFEGLPDWMGDLSAAWQLLDNAMGKCWSVDVGANHESGCYCKITESDDTVYTAIAITPAAAICKAWLSWKTESVFA
jgi:hypothetical protein